MATVNISKIKFRRGTDAQRNTVVFDQGEPVYTLDTKRLFVGTGTDSGGIVVGNKNFTGVINYYSLSTINSQIGDLVHINNKFYQLTATNYGNINSWADVSARIDPTFFNYNASNQITLKVDSISAIYLDSDTVLDGVKIENGLLTADIDSKSLAISANKIYIKPSTIDEREISSSALSFGLSGGSGAKFRLNVDTRYFNFLGNTLSLSALPLSADGTTLNLSAGVLSLKPTIFGGGLQYHTTTSKVSAVLTGLYGSTLTRVPSSGNIRVNPAMFGSGLEFDTVTDTVALEDISANTTNELPMISVDTFGRVIGVESAVFEIFECNSALDPTLNNLNSLSAIFNGIPDPAMGFFMPGNASTVFPCVSSDLTTMIRLSSAGFIAFQGNIGTRSDPADNIPRFAIPIFRF